MFRKAWRGEERLWKMWWLIGVPTELVVSAALAASYFLSGNLLVLIYGMLLAVPVIIAVQRMEWMCAPNVDHRVWMYIVRALIVLRFAVPFGNYVLATFPN